MKLQLLTEKLNETFPQWLVEFLKEGRLIRRWKTRIDLNKAIFVDGKLPPHFEEMEVDTGTYNNEPVFCLKSTSNQDILYTPHMGGTRTNNNVDFSALADSKNPRFVDWYEENKDGHYDASDFYANYLSSYSDGEDVSDESARLMLKEISIHYGYFEDTNVDQQFKLTQDRDKAKQGVVNRGLGQYKEYEFGSEEFGALDLTNLKTKWHETPMQDKSGYVLNPDRLLNKLIDFESKII